MTPSSEPIAEFQGMYRWLSNFASSPMLVDDRIIGRRVVVPTVEHGYQASKTRDPEWRHMVLCAATPGKAKRFGKRLDVGGFVAADWDLIKLDVMFEWQVRKYQIREYAERLLSTGDRPLIEGNYWNDKFWGVCNGEGENYLGRMIMQIRDELRAGGITSVRWSK